MQELTEVRIQNQNSGSEWVAKIQNLYSEWICLGTELIWSWNDQPHNLTDSMIQSQWFTAHCRGEFYHVLQKSYGLLPYCCLFGTFWSLAAMDTTNYCHCMKKYLLSESHIFETTHGWVNDDIMLIFRWTILYHLSCPLSLLLTPSLSHSSSVLVFLSVFRTIPRADRWESCSLSLSVPLYVSSHLLSAVLLSYALSPRFNVRCHFRC